MCKFQTSPPHFSAIASGVYNKCLIFNKNTWKKIFFVTWTRFEPKLVTLKQRNSVKYRLNGEWGTSEQNNTVEATLMWISLVKLLFQVNV